MILEKKTFLVLLIAANLALLPELPLSIRVSGLFIILLAPGLLAAPLLFSEEPRCELLTLGIVLGFAYCLCLFAAGALTGGAFSPAAWIALSSLISIVLLLRERKGDPAGCRTDFALLLVLLLAGFLRFWNLGYSEFQGDESRSPSLSPWA